MGKEKRGTYVRRLDKEIKIHRFLNLLLALVIREIKGRYRKSILGPAWAVLQPLFYMVIFTFLRGVLNIPSEGMPYVVFTFSALVPWTFFSNAVSWCGPSIIANGAVIKKTAVTREVFPVASVATSLLDLAIASIILVGMMVWFEIPVSGTLLWLPLLIAMTAALALGVGLGIAALGTYRRDVIFATPFLMQFWLLATPVMYPVGQVPENWMFLYRLNPMVGIIDGFRRALIQGLAPDLGLLGISLVGISMVWLIGWPLFRHMSQYFADVL